MGALLSADANAKAAPCNKGHPENCPSPTPTPTLVATPTPTAVPTPTATPVPTPTPTPTATPTPTPTATPVVTPTPTPIPNRRFALPVTTQNVTIPSVDKTGATDVSGALQSWVNSAPSGAIWTFTPGTYRIDRALYIYGKNNVIIEGQGVTLKTNGGANISDSAFVLDQPANSHLTIRNFTLDGDNPYVGTVNAYQADQQSAEGVASYHDQSFIELTNLTITDQWGHGVYFGTDGNTSHVAKNVWIHDNTIDGTGLYGVVFAKMDTAWVERNQLIDIGGSPLGFEDGVAPEYIRHVYMGENTLTRWFWTNQYTPHGIVGDGSTGMVWDDITINNNTFTTGPIPNNPNDFVQAGWISFWGSDNHTNIKITNNKSLVNLNGYWFARAQNAPGVIVTGNNAPGAVVFTCIGNCTGAVIGPNP